MWNQENTEQQDLADQWKELCELSMPEGEKVLEAVKNFLEYEESCGKVLKKESEELKKQSETLRMLIQKKEEKNKIFDRLEMEEKQLASSECKTGRDGNLSGSGRAWTPGRAGETFGSAGSSNSEIRAADTGRNRADYCMAEGTGKGTF